MQNPDQTPDGLQFLTTEQLRALPNHALAVVVKELLLSEEGLTTEPGLAREEQIKQNQFQRKELGPVLDDKAYDHVEEVIGAAGFTPTLYSCWWDDNRKTYIVSVLIDAQTPGYIPTEDLDKIPLDYVSMRQHHQRQANFAVPLSAFLPLSEDIQSPTSVAQLEQRAITFEDEKLAAAISERTAQIEQLTAETAALLKLGEDRAFGKIKELAADLDSNTTAVTRLSLDNKKVIVIIDPKPGVLIRWPHALLRRLKALLPGCKVERIGLEDSIKVTAPIVDVLK